MKKGFLISATLVLSMVMSVPAFAQHIFIGDTETVVSYDEKGNKVITLIFDPAKTPDFMKPDSPNYWRKVEQEQAGQPVEQTTTPRIVPASTQWKNETAVQLIPALTEAPKEGEVLANINYLDANGESHFTKPYDGYSIGQCTWYARGRFKETYDVELPHFGNARVWAERAAEYPELEVITDLSDVPQQAVAVYAPRTDHTLPGHVCFVEYVERDENGKPLNVYYTDANGKNDKEKNKYTPGCDGAVEKESFETFLGSEYLKLVGYILPRNIQETVDTVS